MKMNTSELTNLALNWAVATCEGYEGAPLWVARQSNASTDWEQGGPIIERHVPSIGKTRGLGWSAQMAYDYARDRESPIYYGPTPLVAAMRCYVASKFGDDVEIPNDFYKD